MSEALLEVHHDSAYHQSHRLGREYVQQQYEHEYDQIRHRLSWVVVYSVLFFGWRSWCAYRWNIAWVLLLACSWKRHTYGAVSSLEIPKNTLVYPALWNACHGDWWHSIFCRLRVGDLGIYTGSNRSCHCVAWDEHRLCFAHRGLCSERAAEPFKGICDDDHLAWRCLAAVRQINWPCRCQR